MSIDKLRPITRFAHFVGEASYLITESWQAHQEWELTQVQNSGLNDVIPQNSQFEIHYYMRCC